MNNGAAIEMRARDFRLLDHLLVRYALRVDAVNELDQTPHREIMGECENVKLHLPAPYCVFACDSDRNGAHCIAFSQKFPDSAASSI